MAAMKPFVQTFSFGTKLWLWLLLGTFLNATKASAATQTLLLRPDCAVIRIMDPAQVPLICKASQAEGQFENIGGTQKPKTQVKAASLQIEAGTTALRSFNIPDSAAPLHIPQRLDHPEDYWLAALSHPLQTWEATALSHQCCDLLQLRPPSTAQLVRLSIQKTFIVYTMIGLILHGIILITLNVRRLPRGKRRRRRTRGSLPLRRTPFPLRLLPRQRIHEKNHLSSPATL